MAGNKKVSALTELTTSTPEDIYYTASAGQPYYIRRKNIFPNNVTGISISGGISITGALNINAGTNVTLTQAGLNTFSISAAIGTSITGISITGGIAITGALNISASGGIGLIQTGLNSLILNVNYRNSGDIWLATRTDGRDGVGTLFDPRDVSTTAKFDAIFETLLVDKTYHLLPGTYTTKGSYPNVRGLAKGNKLIGGGSENTTIKIDPAWTTSDAGYNNGRHVVVMASAVSNENQENITISNLTLDCNYSNIVTVSKTGYAFGHVHLHGRNSMAEQMRFLNGHDAVGLNAVECFCAYVIGPNSVIRDCMLTDFNREQGSGESLSATLFTVGQNGLIDNVIGNLSGVANKTGETTYFNGFGCYYAGTVLQNSKFIGAYNISAWAVYNDTDIAGQGFDNEPNHWVIQNNEFIDIVVGVGAVFNNINLTDVKIVNNYFYLLSGITDCGALYIHETEAGSPNITNCIFSNNTVDGSGIGQAAIHFHDGITVTNLILENNIIKSGMTCTLPTGSAIIGHNNLMTDGTLAVNTNTNLPFGISKFAGLSHGITTKTTSYPLTVSDHTILLNGATLTATLPTAVGCKGQEYTIKLIISSTATVATTSSQTIDGSTTYSLSALYKYVTVQSDNANWHIISNN